jgi:DNA (cytosine-5)-methyltransferase 1
MRFIDMFGGIGGFSLGLERCNHECVGYYEWDKYCVSVYNRNFGTGYKPTDITKVESGDIPDFDILCAGFPCQAFSIAGKRKGFQDIRGTLFEQIVRIAKDKRPAILFLENVKGLLNHDGGETFATILHEISKLGYAIEWEVLNSKNFGVPQNRERVFIIGHLGDGCGQEVFPIGRSDPKNSKLEEQGKPTREIMDTLTARGAGEMHSGMRLVVEPHEQQTIIRQPLRFLKRNQKNIEGDYAFTVDAGQTSGVNINSRIRRLTPTECERLQGFPDGWTSGHSDTQRYKMLGNAVTVNVIEEIGRRLFS